MARRALSPRERASLRRVVGAYFAYQTFAAANFFWPVFVVFYQRWGRIDLPAIFALQAFYTLARVVLEVPLGVLADRYGRRPALAASAALTALGCVVIVSDSTLPAFYAAELCFAAAVAAKSGADSALLFDVLAQHGQLEDYPGVEGRAQSLGALAGAISAIASGFLLEVWVTLPYLATLAAAGAALAAAIVLDEPARRTHAPQGLAGVARGAMREIAASPPALWLVALYTVLIVLSHVVFYLQQPYFESIGIPVAAFGLVVAGSKLVHAAVAHRAARIERAVSPRRMPAFLLAAALTPVALMGAIAHPIGVLFVPLRGVADGLLQPVVNFYLNRLVSPMRRASVLSLSSLAARLVQAAAIWAFGLALARFSTASTLQLAAACGAAAAAIVLWIPRAARRAATRAPSAVAPPSRQALRAGEED